jgi:uncharacterized lipoprotein YddW (UPF0748 family)
MILRLIALSIFLIACQKVEDSSPTPTTPTQNTTKQPSNAIRGFWLPNVDNTSLDSRAGLKKTVDDCEKYGFNRIYVVMWNQGMTCYPSKIMKDNFGIEINPKYAGRDPLKELIEEAHAKKIKVIAWFEYGFAADYAGANAHILTKKPEWAGRDSKGGILTKNNFRWMNAFHPDVQNFMMSLLKECVQNYDVDGIQGDDRLPALPSEGGYDDYTLAQFKKEKGKDAPQNHLDAEWMEWKYGKLNLFSERIYKEIKAIKKDCIVSMAPSIFPWARDNYLQDWVTWVKNGWVDEICPQIYRYDLTAYQNELNKIVLQQIPNDKLKLFAPGVLLKVGSYVATPEFLGQMVNANRKLGIEGEVFFHYAGIAPRDEFFMKLY